MNTLIVMSLRTIDLLLYFNGSGEMYSIYLFDLQTSVTKKQPNVSKAEQEQLVYEADQLSWSHNT